MTTTTTLTSRHRDALLTRYEGGYNRNDISTAFTAAQGRTFRGNDGTWYAVNQRRRLRSFGTKSEAMRWANGSR